MTPTRPAFWNIDGLWVMYLVTFVETAVFAYGIYRAYARWRRAGGHLLFDHPLARLRRATSSVLAHRVLLRDRVAGVSHMSFFWGFVLLGIGTIVAMLDEELHVPIMRGDFYLYFQSLVLDVAGVVAIVGVLVAVIRRYVTRVPRVRSPLGRQTPVADAFALFSLLVILTSGYVIEGIRIHVTADPWAAWSPVGNAVAATFEPANPNALMALHAGLWWGHLVLASAFVALIPYTKMLHVITAPISIFYAPIESAVAPRPIDFERDESFGLSVASQLSRRQMLELDACTECGRCQDACPAYALGQPLSPKALVVDLRDSVRSGVRHRPVNPPATAVSLVSDSEPVPQLIAAVSPEAVWSCVTCGACMQECPVSIKHVPTIVELRQHLVMERAEYPQKLQAAMSSLESRGTPYRGAGISRLAWAEGLGVRSAAETGGADYLYWVGCAAAFDGRAQRVARSFARLLQRAGVDFVVLGDEESCNGDPARQVGNEFQFQAQVRTNIGTLGRYQFRKIVATCPHCFNSLRNYYPDLAARYEIVHHSELLVDLVAQGRLRPERGENGTTTYHDPCYLGRYNQRYDKPRSVLQSIPSLSLVEMDKTRDRSFCCGAGGGHMWTEEISGGRINHRRAEHALATGAATVATACPFCTVMLEDGAATRSAPGAIQVLDIAEILDAATTATDRTDDPLAPE